MTPMTIGIRFCSPLKETSQGQYMDNICTTTGQRVIENNFLILSLTLFLYLSLSLSLSLSLCVCVCVCVCVCYKINESV